MTRRRRLRDTAEMFLNLINQIQVTKANTTVIRYRDSRNFAATYYQDLFKKMIL